MVQYDDKNNSQSGISTDVFPFRNNTNEIRQCWEETDYTIRFQKSSICN